MTRFEMANVLVEKKLTEWTKSLPLELLRMMLFAGHKGYSEYSEKELKKEIEKLTDLELNHYRYISNL